MRKLRVFESVSIDGYFTDARNELAWAHRAEADADEEFAAFIAGNADAGRGGELVMGRITYAMMASWWPTPAAAAAMPAVAAGMNARTKHVATRDATFAPAWQNTVRLVGTDAVAAVRALKASAGPDLAVLGSGSLVAQLGAADLVDDYQLVILPLALGAGRPIFSRGASLRLVDHRAFRCGNLVVTYAAR